jgi:hypothetical protein
MSRHYDRTSHYLIDEGFLGVDPFLPDSNLFTNAEISHDKQAESVRRDEGRAFQFGRMFHKRAAPKDKGAACMELVGLLELGRAMNEVPQGVGAPLGKPKDDASIPSGYTYLGQFLTHEITFNKTDDLTAEEVGDLSTVKQARSPSVDLDSLYGRGPSDKTHGPAFYKDHARLREGETYPTKDWDRTISHDLPRGWGGERKATEAVIPDPRNDENLMLAQTQLAFIKFHNKVVDQLASEGVAEGDQFRRAREQVVRHFQWIVLKQFLPLILDAGVLDEVVRRAKDGPLSFFRPSDRHGLFMPVEFSAAAFRIGHSMVRGRYEWNFFINSEQLGNASVLDLFRRSGFSGDLDNYPRLESKWVIDWRRFYDFRGAGILTDGPDFNRAKRIDTNFNFQLNTVPFYPHPPRESFRPLTARNLIRGFMLGLPTGQDVAAEMKVAQIPPDDIARGPHEKFLRSYGFHEHTPLWYYVLKEAELCGGSCLGPVGSLIVAETIVGIIKESEYSILKGDWSPQLGGRRDRKVFDMTDMLEYAEVINPIGE